MKTEHQKRVRRLVEVAADRQASPDSHARELGVDAAACPRAVAAEIRATVANVLTSRRGTVYRFGSLVVAFGGGGAFVGVGVEYYNGLSFEPARPNGARR